MVARAAAGLTALVAASAACASRPPVPVTVLVEGEASMVAQVTSALAAAKLPELVVRQVGLPPPEEPELGQAALAAAFDAFLAGDGSSCREHLAAVELPRLLAHRQRAAVARALLLDARCAEGLGNTAAAEARMDEFASYELELGEATGVLSPTLRARFDQALARQGRAPRARVEVTGAPSGRLWIDGRTAACVLPCAPSLGHGAHVLAVESEGVALSYRRVEITGPTSLSLPAVAASAAEAAQQWHARAGRGAAVDDATSLGLLPLALADQRVAYLRAGEDDRALGVRGALVLRGRRDVAARGHRGRAADAPALVRQLAIDAGVIAAPRPRWFWPVLVGSVVGSVALTAALLYEPEIRTQVEL